MQYFFIFTFCVKCYSDNYGKSPYGLSPKFQKLYMGLIRYQKRVIEIVGLELSNLKYPQMNGYFCFNLQIKGIHRQSLVKT